MLESSSNQVFDFNEAFAELVTQQGIETPSVAPAATEADLRQALRAAGEAAYRWNIETDEIIWSPNAPEVLGCPLAAISAGKQFASLLDIENVTTRYETVMNSRLRDSGRGVAFQIEYLFRPEGRQNAKAIWLEDIGRWQAGPDGLPKTVFGTLRQVDERHRRDQHLNFLSSCDPLTGMMNQGRMMEALDQAVSVAKKAAGACAFVIAAINNLPLVNEAYGFDVADEVIVAAARRLRQVMRVGDGIARLGGGKFGIILNDCNETDLEMALRRYLSVIRDNVIETGRGPVWATLSIGAINLPADADDAATALSRAEEALNEARKLPSDGQVIYKPSERRTAERALNARCATEIVKCLKEDRFKLAYQPVLHARTGEAVFHEALLRMQDEATGELIAASHLVPIAEHLGLVRLVDRAVMQMIIQTLHVYPEAQLSMNLSGTTATDPYWYDQLLDVIFANQQAASRLTLEITETVALNDMQSTRRFVEKLREAGCSVAIDDFGAGFTSFKHLRELPVNILKFDGSFCRNLGTDKDNEYMVRSLIDLSGKFNLKTVAEWVETEEDAAALKAWGIDYLQGNLFGEASVLPPWTIARANRFDIGGDEQPDPLAASLAEAAERDPEHEIAMHHHTASGAGEGQSDEPIAPGTAYVEMNMDITPHTEGKDFEPEPLMFTEALEAPPEVETPAPVFAEDEPVIAMEEPLPPAVEEAAPAEPELVFADIDESIARLRAALADLSAAQAATPDRDAA
ncbi:MAG: EAL domain-containing protein [Alphaproteobacteria bacterium]|nr:EAL domain-containing protein [Alphaproteobacteria bacterium]